MSKLNIHHFFSTWLVALIPLTFCAQNSIQLLESSYYNGSANLDYLESSNSFVYTIYSPNFIDFPAQYGIWEDQIAENNIETAGIKSIFLDEDWNALQVFEGGPYSFALSHLEWYALIDGVGYAAHRPFFISSLDSLNYNISGPYAELPYRQLGFNFDFSVGTLNPEVFVGEFSSSSGNSVFSDLRIINLASTYDRLIQSVFEQSSTVYIRPAFGQQFINEELINDLGEGQLGYNWINYSGIDDQMQVNTIISDGDLMMINDIYRIPEQNDCIGLISTRGEDVLVDNNGMILEGVSGDSTFATSLFRADQWGNMSWITPLYSFNNFLVDGVQGTSMNRSIRGHLLTLSDKVLYSEQAIFSLQDIENDTLFYKDFFGVDSSFYHNSNALISGNNSTSRVLGKSRLYTLDASDGDKLGLIELDGFQYWRTSSDTVTDRTSLQLPQVFKVENKLAWVNDFHVSNDTLIRFNRKMVDGSFSQYEIPINAGINTIILWLDQEFNIEDHWVIEGQSENSDFPLLGIRLTEIASLGQDSVLIAAMIDPFINTSMDPFGNSDSQSDTDFRAFLGLYAPEPLNTSQVAYSDISLFPNPTTGSLFVELGEFEAERALLMDLSGRVLESRAVQSQRLEFNLSRYANGLYFVRLEGNGANAVYKVVKGD
jgi:hypothetical protein